MEIGLMKENEDGAIMAGIRFFSYNVIEIFKFLVKRKFSRKERFAE
jgi:CTP:phosphocholine cytidylyltransferase-like protein